MCCALFFNDPLFLLSFAWRPRPYSTWGEKPWEYESVSGTVFTFKLNYMFIMLIRAHLVLKHQSVTNQGNCNCTNRVEKKGYKVAYSKKNPHFYIEHFYMCVRQCLHFLQRKLYMEASAFWQQWNVMPQDSQTRLEGTVHPVLKFHLFSISPLCRWEHFSA